jgi:DNA-binding MarR family transcriptional regulator
MNANFFGLKRAFHGTLRITRRALAKLGLTAARFDLLYALPHDPRRYDGGLRQSALRRELGVSRPTVSRMLISLEGLGLVGRERCHDDRRQYNVKLTSRGRALIRKAVRHFIDSGWAQLALDSAFGRPGSDSRDDHDTYCFVQMDALESLLNCIRHAFGDFASLYYPWHPDD